MRDAEHGMARVEVTGPLDAKAAKADRNRLWREENRAALEAYAEEVAREGLPLAAFRTF